MSAPVQDQIAGTLPKRTGRPRTATCGTRSAYTMGCRCGDCTEANRAYQLAWREKNPAARARHAVTSARWRRNNAERARETDQAWRDRNREHVRAQQRAYYAAHREKCIEQATRSRMAEQASTVRSSINYRQPWTAAEDRQLAELYPRMTAGQVGRIMGRTAYGIRNRAKTLQLSKADS